MPYEQMDSEATDNYTWWDVKARVKADTTDYEIEKMVDDWEDEVNADGYTLWDGILVAVMDYRDSLVAERELEMEDDDDC